MHGGGYGSEFDDGGENRKRRHDSIGYGNTNTRNYHSSQLPSKNHLLDSYDREQQRLDFAKFKSLNAYDRHRLLIHDYIKYYGGKIEDFASEKKVKTDFDVIQENHRFVWDNNDDSDVNSKTWGQKLAKKYYDKLFKEYCISDLSRYKQKQFAMRWRTEKEVQNGKGQFSCGARKCEEEKGLKTWEVNFVYIEHGEKKNTLIKLRLCPDCSYRLNYHKKHKEIKRKEKNDRKKKKRKKKKKKHTRHSDSDSSSSSCSDELDDNTSTLQNEGEASSSSKPDSESTIWKKAVEEPTEKSKDELYDDYLEDLFM